MKSSDSKGFLISITHFFLVTLTLFEGQMPFEHHRVLLLLFQHQVPFAHLVLFLFASQQLYGLHITSCIAPLCLLPWLSTLQMRIAYDVRH